METEHAKTKNRPTSAYFVAAPSFGAQGSSSSPQLRPLSTSFLAGTKSKLLKHHASASESHGTSLALAILLLLR